MSTTTKYSLAGTAGGLFLVAVFVVWAELDVVSLHRAAREDGYIEYASALLFLLSSVNFLIMMKRSRFLKEKPAGLKYSLILCWALLMFVFAGEEISWGQRVLGFETPESLAAVNKQAEFNIHNIAVVDEFVGGKYRYLSVMMLMTGLVLPLLALNKHLQRVFHWFAFPVSPLAYWPFFVGAYLFARYYMNSGSLIVANDAAEAREFIMSVGMFLFSLHGAIRPRDLLKTARPPHAG